jgi:hypothetical protein
MTVTTRLKIVVLAGAVAATSLAASQSLPTVGLTGFVSQAEARVGRPLTPVSVAGVARRTVRRCAVGVYYC